MPKNDDLPGIFHDYVSGLVDETGIYPFPCCSLDPEGEFNVAALDFGSDPRLVYEHFWGLVTREQHQAVIIGLDRTTRPGQGTEFNDVLTCLHWWHDPAINWGKTLCVGVINYQNEPRIVRPWDWKNSYWTTQVLIEARKLIPPFRISVTNAGEHHTQQEP